MLTRVSENVGPGVVAKVLTTLMTAAGERSVLEMLRGGWIHVLPRKRVRCSFGMTAARKAPAKKELSRETHLERLRETHLERFRPSSPGTREP